MHNLDMPELIANDVDQYIQNAVNWAGDLNRLRQLRMGMRDRMAKSPLMDSKQFAHDVELVFRQMWRNWCENHKT
jgi:predicted O-linked N-acetylglucosamine transferase (SPINDLY family)